MKHYQIGLGLIFMLMIFVLYTNCGPGLTPNISASIDLSSAVPGYECEEQLDSRAEIPSTIDDMTEFINDLPKPLTIPCLIAAFEPPLSVYAVASPLSAQPSIRPESPRIFIVKNNLLISIVPEGLGKDLVEFGEITENMVSVKAELEFPVTSQLSLGAPFDTVKDQGFVPGGTNCRFCHAGETLVTNMGLGEAYKSALSPPNPSFKVPVPSLKQLASSCPIDTEPFRCAMLRFVAAEAIDLANFPTSPQ